MAQWYYTRNGQQAGPVDEAELSRLLSSGQVSATDMVWKDGMPNWLTAASVPELSGAAGGAAYGTDPQTYGQPQYGQPQYGQPQYGQPQQPQYGQGQSGQTGQPLNYGGYAGQAAGYPGQATGKSNFGLALTSLILSSIGVVFCPFLFALGGIILGIVALVGMKKSGNYRGRGLAIAGIAVGVLAIPFNIIFAVWLTSQQHHGGFRY